MGALGTLAVVVVVVAAVLVTRDGDRAAEQNLATVERESTTTDPSTTTSTSTTLASTTTTTVAPTTSLPPAPEILGSPGEWGMDYPSPLTCADVGAFMETLNTEGFADASAAVTGQGIWLAIDRPSLSADVWLPYGPNRSLVYIRGGMVISRGEPSSDKFPALSGFDDYATADVVAGDVTSCQVGRVVG
ncbi:hypothetical protein [Rhabdothermincola salaria]|uniref:hypothetical protein n=1 Tax=Rhabdothermincola salaria TaxID=2903142 RepID=UPI001E42AC7B|nr:hypothetical protein [Rhabdothermincola salaria]MCD9624226.1 hypothetical protein [Rhabdothermincola salaria]